MTKRLSVLLGGGRGVWKREKERKLCKSCIFVTFHQIFELYPGTSLFVAVIRSAAAVLSDR